MYEQELYALFIGGLVAQMVWMINILVIDMPSRVQVGLQVLAALAAGALLWLYLGFVAALSMTGVLLVMHSVLALLSRRADKRRAAEMAYYQAAGLLAGLIAASRKQ